MRPAAGDDASAQDERAPLAPWWGQYALDEGAAGFWRIGPLALWVRRRTREWRLAWRHDAEVSPDAGSGSGEAAPALEIRLPLGEDELPEGLEVARFAAQATTPDLRLVPGLADRPVVARPETPFHLLGGERVTFYVATPTWVRLRLTGDRPLAEVPTQRLVETWLGPSTLVGEVCYVSRTKARLELARLPRLPHLAFTRVTVHNRPQEPLLLERLSLPAPSLGLWWHPELGLWTQAVSVDRELDGTLATVRLGEGPPTEVRGAEPVAPPARPESRPALVRALGALLG